MQGYMCASNTPCLDDSGLCTDRCIPLAASWCQSMCPNALQFVPTTNPVSPKTLLHNDLVPLNAPCTALLARMAGQLRSRDLTTTLH